MRLPAPPSIVWYSTPESRKIGSVSFLAIAETLVCVALYWLIWLKWGVSWQHWLIVIVTPLVLMRTDASVKKGVHLFDLYWRRSESHYYNFILPLLLGFSASIFLAYALHFYWQEQLYSYSIFLTFKETQMLEFSISTMTVLIFGFSIAFAIEKPSWYVLLHKPGFEFGIIGGITIFVFSLLITIMYVGINEYKFIFLLAFMMGFSLVMFSFALILGAILGLFFRAFVIRIYSTFSYPLIGFQAIPYNWHRVVWQLDFRESPQLIPGHTESSFRYAVNFFNGHDQRIFSSGFVYLFTLYFFYLPPLLWRFMIKSTAWFYLPLLWIGRGWQNFQGDDLLIWAKGYSAKWSNITVFIISVILLFCSFVALVVPERFFDLEKILRDNGAPFPLIGWTFVLDWKSLATQPWQWFYLPSWIITLLLFFVLNDQSVDLANGANPNKRLRSLRGWMWVHNIRALFTNLGLLVALIYFLGAVDAIGQIESFFSILSF